MQLSPELLQQIQAAIQNGTLQLGNPAGRSPIKPRQLHDLRLLPTKDDPRPTFFWSAESPRDVGDLTRTTEFPKLMWHAEGGQEITIHSAEEQRRLLTQGYVLTAPASVVIDVMDQMRAQFEALSAEDQALLIDAQKQDRLAALRAQLGTLPEDKLQAMLAQADPAKRKPGRPKKEQVA